MTPGQLIDLLEKSGMLKEESPGVLGWHPTMQKAEAFAAIVAAHEREEILKMLEAEWFGTQADIEVAIRERLKQPYCDDCGGTDAECPLAQPESNTIANFEAIPEQTHCEKCFWTDPLCSVKQPEQTPLDRMADNARELGLDYESQHTKKYVTEPVAWTKIKLREKNT